MQSPVSTKTIAPSEAGYRQAAEILAAGGLVAFPTETVYGLGADARNEHAVSGIYRAKARPEFNPLIVHVATVEQAHDLIHLGTQGARLAAAFWPGPLTLVGEIRASAGIAASVVAGLPTLAVRVPAHPVAAGLLNAFGGPVAAPSANPSGQISPTSARHVLQGLGGRIDAVIDAGPCNVGVESTIVDLTDPPRILRPGGLPAEAIADCLGHKPSQSPEGAAIKAPGQLASHYAPNARLVLNAAQKPVGALWLGFGPNCPEADLNLSPAGELAEAAANLFEHLHLLDARAAPGQSIAVAPIPHHGLGVAINDRLRRAAAPR